MNGLIDCVVSYFLITLRAQVLKLSITDLFISLFILCDATSSQWRIIVFQYIVLLLLCHFLVVIFFF